MNNPKLPECLQADGIWCQQLRRPPAGPALFLDRDGTLIEERHYLRDPSEVHLLPGAAATVAAANQRGLAVVVVTNQSGIGRGLLSWQDFARVEARLAALLSAGAAGLDLVLACPFHPAAAPYRVEEHPCRKPRPGMLLRAAELLDLDLAGSWIVGDKASDLAAGKAAGLAGGLLVETGYGRTEKAAASSLAESGFSLRGGKTIAAALGLPLFGI
jgi:D-glycero-D-manno-heptose 1,7-bisphosphate phosphatase